MSYDEREKAPYSGQPLECFKFTRGSTIYRYTSADVEVVLPDGTFEPEPIKRKEEAYTEEGTTESVEIEMPVTLGMAADLVGGVQCEPISLIIFRAHRGDEEDCISAFTGYVMAVRATPSQVTLSCASVTALLERQVPAIAMQTQCNHALFSQGCTLDGLASIWRKAVSISAVDGCTVTADEFENYEDQYYRGGIFEAVSGEKRFIVDHQGDTVILFAPIPSLEVGQYAYATWGCDHSEETCLKKFGNLANHLGFAHIPGRNPFRGRLA